MRKKSLRRKSLRKKSVKLSRKSLTRKNVRNRKLRSKKKSLKRKSLRRNDNGSGFSTEASTEASTPTNSTASSPKASREETESELFKNIWNIDYIKEFYCIDVENEKIFPGGYSTSNFSTQMIENKNNMDTFKKSVVEFFIHPKKKLKDDLELLELEHKDIKAFLNDKKEQLITKVFAKLLFNLYNSILIDKYDEIKTKVDEGLKYKKEPMILYNNLLVKYGDKITISDFTNYYNNYNKLF
jgi:hypothetical protein